MASGLKTLLTAGMGAESAFGTGAAATQDLKLVSENILVSGELKASDFLTGSRAKEYVGLGGITVGGSLVEQMRYLLTTDPAHVLLKQAFGSAYGHVYRNLTRESWVPHRQGAADNIQLSIGVTPAVTASAGVRVRLYLKRTGAPSGNLAVEIQGDTAGDPDGTPIANGTSANVAASSITTDSAGQWVEFTFASSPTLTAATAYHCVLTGTYATSVTDYISWAVEDVASSGVFEIKDAAWANDTTKNGVARILTTSFTDSYIMADTIEGQSTTLAVDKTVSVHEWLGLKVKSLTLTSTPDGLLRAAYDLVGYDEDQSPTNTAAVIQGLRRVRVFPLHSDLVFWIGDQADVLATGDLTKVDSWELKIERPLDETMVSGQRQILEPLESGMGTVSLTIKIPRYAADTFRAWQVAGTKLQARAHWTDATRYLTCLAPNAIIDGAVDVATGDQAAYSQSVTLTCFRNNGQNGLMQVSDEAELNLLNV